MSMQRSGWIVIALLAVGGVVVALRSDRRPPAPREHPNAPPRFVQQPPARVDTEIDLDSLRRALPDNSYWKSGAPTTDAATLEARAREERRRNELYGRVLEGTASVDDIDRYYDGLRRRSEDALQVAEEALRRQGDRLPARERGLFELAARMNRDRLASLPREREKAVARKRAHDERRLR